MPEFKLKNGADLIAKYGDIVLASWDGHTFPYVTWKVDSEGNAYWGRYFADYNAALMDFVNRAKGFSRVTAGRKG